MATHTWSRRWSREIEKICIHKATWFFIEQWDDDCCWYVLCCVLLAIVGKFKLSSNRLLRFYKCLRKGSIILGKAFIYFFESVKLSVSFFTCIVFCLFVLGILYCHQKIMYIAGRLNWYLLDWYCLAISKARTAEYYFYYYNDTKLAFYHFPFSFYGKRVLW